MILLLGPISPLVEFLSDREATLVTAEPIDLPFIERHRPDFIVSYNYRHKIGREVLEWMHGKAINLHISLLPYNRGAHPNFWSWVNNTPKGVTIHQIHEAWDTGDILVQREVMLDPRCTFRDTYVYLHSQIREVFREKWARLRCGDICASPQPFVTKLHLNCDLDVYRPYLADGWDTPINQALEAICEANRINEDSGNFWASGETRESAKSADGPGDALSIKQGDT